MTNLTMDDMLAIVKPHNDKIVMEGLLAEAEREIKRLRALIAGDTPEQKKALAHRIYKAWQADERWLRMDMAAIARGSPLAFFWAEIAAKACSPEGELHD